MRDKLRVMDGERKRFRGVFGRFGSKKNFHGFLEKALLFKDIKLVEDQKTLTDHHWLNYTKGFQELDLEVGDNGLVRQLRFSLCVRILGSQVRLSLSVHSTVLTALPLLV